MLQKYYESIFGIGKSIYEKNEKKDRNNTQKLLTKIVQ